MKAFKVQWHSDSGHEWLEVSINDFFRAKLNLEDISAYSYFQHDKKSNQITLYLEGDLDAAIFLKAWEAAGFDIEAEAACDYHAGDCFIRNLPRTNTGKNKPRYDLLGIAA